MSQRFSPAAGLAAALLAPVPIVVAADYLSIDAAQRVIFPQADAFQEVLVSPTDAQLQAMLARAGAQPHHGTIRIWKAMRGGVLEGHVMLDEVIGRQNLITYAVGIDGNGALKSLEILAYRESHGGEIRNPAWRAQFEGRRSLEQLQFRTDIKNISGATLSSEHVTEGVRWLMALWDATLKPHGAPG